MQDILRSEIIDSDPHIGIIRTADGETYSAIRVNIIDILHQPELFVELVILGVMKRLS